MLRVVWPPHCDYLRCTTPGAVAEASGFIKRQDPGKGMRWWMPGWWAKEEPTGKGDGMRTNADAEAVARTWPQAWASAFHVTRVDIACDVVFKKGGPDTAGMPRGFEFEHKDLFTGRGAKQTIEKMHRLKTLYLGGRESPVMLRIYMKFPGPKCTERDKSRWLEHGWNGRDEVWRIEYQFNRKAIPENLELPRDVGALWADGLARIRMCAVNPRTYSEQRHAPTHPLWRSLGQPRKLTRRALDLAGCPDEPTQAAVLRALDKLGIRAGVAFLPEMVARLQRAIEISGLGKRNRNGSSSNDDGTRRRARKAAPVR